jgi:hypothetical protein
MDMNAKLMKILQLFPTLNEVSPQTEEH